MKQSMKNQTIYELYTDDKNRKHSSNCNDILKSAKNFYEKLYTKDTLSKTDTAELFSKIYNRKKISIIQFHHCQANIF